MLAILAIAAAPCTSAAAWIVDGDVVLFHDDNLTRAQAAADRRADRAAALRMSFGMPVVVSGYDAVLVSAQLESETFARYRGLDFASAGVSVLYRRKLALGLAAPYVAASATTSYARYREDVRDGGRLALRLEAGRRFDASLSAAIGASHDRRDGDHGVALVPGIPGAIFDLQGNAVHANADLTFGERWQAGAAMSVRRGDVESTSRRNLPVFLASTAIAADPAFGDPELIGYRLRGTTLTASAALSYALDDRASLNVGYVHEVTRAAQGIEYRSRNVNASLAWRL